MSRNPLPLVWLFMMLCTSLMAQNPYDPSLVSPEVNSLVSQIVQGKVLSGRYALRNQEKTKQYQRFENLHKIASRKELMTLSNHPNGLVRCYAFWALAKNKPKKLETLLEAHVADNEKVKTLFKYKVGEIEVRQFMLDLVSDNSIDPDAFKLENTEMARLNALIKH